MAPGTRPAIGAIPEVEAGLGVGWEPDFRRGKSYQARGQDRKRKTGTSAFHELASFFLCGSLTPIPHRAPLRLLE